MAKYGEITVKFRYPIEPNSYPDLAYDDQEGMVAQDVESIKNSDFLIEDIMESYEEVSGRVIDVDEPEEVIEVPEDDQ